MADERIRVVVDTSAVGGLPKEAVDRMRAEARNLWEAGITQGEPALVKQAEQLVKAIQEADQAGPAISEEKMTAAEVKELETFQAQATVQQETEERRVAAATEMAGEARAEMKATLDLATKMEDGSATEAERDKAIALALRQAARGVTLNLGGGDDS